MTRTGNGDDRSTDEPLESFTDVRGNDGDEPLSTSAAQTLPDADDQLEAEQAKGLLTMPLFGDGGA